MWEDWRARFPFLDTLERDWEAIRDEALAIPPEAWRPMPSEETYEGGWHIYPLLLGPWAHEYPGSDLALHLARCPAAARTLAALGEVPVAGFLRVDEGASIHTHQDFRADDEVRCHLGLVTPEGSGWAPGTARVLDIRSPHSARNPGPGPRITLMVDVRLPFVLPTGVLPPWTAR